MKWKLGMIIQIPFANYTPKLAMSLKQLCLPQIFAILWSKLRRCPRLGSL